MSYEEQIMSKDKYPSIFSPQMEVLSCKSFTQRAQFENWGKIGEYPRIFPSFSPRDAFRPIVLERRGKYFMDYKSHYTIPEK